MYNEKDHQRRQRRLFEIVQCLKEGLDTNQIAEELEISRRTIQRDVKYIRENQKG